MAEQNNKVKIFVNEEIFGQRNLLTVTGKIEISLSKKENYFATELIYLSFTDTYNTNSTITMQLKGIDVYNLIGGLEDVLLNNKSDFKKFTDSNKSKNSDAAQRKFLVIKVDGTKVFINLNISDNTTSNNFKPISNVSFEYFEIKGVIKTLEAFMIEYKSVFYKTQRAYEKLNKKKIED